MAHNRIPSDTVAEIHRLHDADVDAGAIAAQLGLHRLEVQAILMHRALKGADAQNDKQDSQVVEFREAANEPDSLRLEARQEQEADIAIAEQPEDEEESGVFLGEQTEYDVPVYWRPEAENNPHIMIVGESGSGKTYATQCLVAELAQTGIPSIIFDYGQGFEAETLPEVFKARCKPQEHRVGEEGLSLSPLQIFSRDLRGPNQVATRLADVFDAVFHLGDIQKRVFVDAILRIYRQHGILQADSKTWAKKAPSLLAVREAIDELAADKEYPQKSNAQGLGARLMTFFMLAAFNDSSWSWDELIADKDHRVHVIQFRGLEGKTQRVMVEVLLWHLYYHLKSHGQQSLRAYIVLDEAHHLSFRDSGPLQQLLRESRKFGIGIMFASQQPEDFSAVAYQNSASKLVFQTTDPKMQVSRALAGKASNYQGPDEIRSTIASLERGTALFIRGQRGTIVGIADFAKRSTYWGASA